MSSSSSSAAAAAAAAVTTYQRQIRYWILIFYRVTIATIVDFDAVTSAVFRVSKLPDIQYENNHVEFNTRLHGHIYSTSDTAIIASILDFFWQKQDDSGSY